MTLKEIKTKYNIIKRDGKYHLHCLMTTGRTVYKYICSIEKTKGYKFNVIGFEPVNTFAQLEKQIKEYLEGLEYDSEYYSPLYREGFGQELLIRDLLHEYGFKTSYHYDSFRLDRKSIYGYDATNVSVNYYIDVDNKEIRIILHTGRFSWVQTKCSFDFKDIHKSLDGLLKPLFLTEGVENIKTSDKMQNSNIEAVIKQLQGFDEITSKVELKDKLLELANTL